jgi:plasmid stabilization system protein ParE
MPKFSISLTAQRQIKEIIAYYLENETKERADKILDSFYEMFHFAAQNPYALPKADASSTNSHIRKGVIYNTYIFRYQIFENHIRITRIYHGKRDF